MFDASTKSKSYNLTAAYTVGSGTTRKAICLTLSNKSFRFLVGRQGAYDLYSCACMAWPLLSSRVGRQCHRHSRRCDLDGTHGKPPFSAERCYLYPQSNRHQLCGRSTGGGSRTLGCNCCRICRLRHFLCPCLFILCVLRVLLLAWLMCGLRAFACVEQRKSVWVVRG